MYLVVDRGGTLVGAGSSWREVRSSMVAHVLRRMRQEADALLEEFVLREVLGVASGEVAPMSDEQFEAVVREVMEAAFAFARFGAMLKDYSLEAIA